MGVNANRERFCLAVRLGIRNTASETGTNNMRLDVATPRITRARAWLRVCRPLLLWLTVFLVASGYQWHQRLLRKTRLLASVTLSGNDIRYAAEITVDGRHYEFNDPVSLGRHVLIIRCPKATTFQTNLFVWYGVRELGQIQLQRAEGSLRIVAAPAAPKVKVKSREWQKDFTGTPSGNISVPTDDYTVTAVYPHFTVEKNVAVTEGNIATCSFAPIVGALQATSAQRGVRFQLYRAGDSRTENLILEQGELPVLLPTLKVGRYGIRTTFRGAAENHLVEVTANQTNKIELDFPLGRVILETIPAGATVREADGEELGKTPLTLEEVPTGVWRGEVVLANYVPITIGVEVAAKQTSTFQTNLVRHSFARAMELGAQMKEESSANFVALIEALSEAVRDDPSNAVAADNLKKARVGEAMWISERKFHGGDYAGALRDAESALAIMPDNAKAQRAVTNLKRTVEENQSKDKEAKERLAVTLRERRPREYFAELMSKTAHSELFEEKEMKVNGSVEDIRTKIADAIGSGLLKYKIEEDQQAFEEGFLIRAKRSMLDGFSRCYIVGGQTADREVIIRFKVFEYILPSDKAITGLFKEPGEEVMIPIHSTRIAASRYQIFETRRAQNLQMVIDRIQKAVTK